MIKISINLQVILIKFTAPQFVALSLSPLFLKIAVIEASSHSDDNFPCLRDLLKIIL